MFKEFAVDPGAIVRSDRDLVYVLEKFGMHQGRTISEFPARWKRLAYEAAHRRHGWEGRTDTDYGAPEPHPRWRAPGGRSPGG
jgi:hypothetical protein